MVPCEEGLEVMIKSQIPWQLSSAELVTRGKECMRELLFPHFSICMCVEPVDFYVLNQKDYPAKQNINKICLYISE